MEIITNNNNCWDKSSSKSVFWRKPRSDIGTDTSLRSITPHIVRSRLLLFGNVLVDQKHALAIHNVHNKCNIHRGGLNHKSDYCGSIHFGFCKAIQEQREKLDVKSHIEKFENETQVPEKQTFSSKKTSHLVIPLMKKPAKDRLKSPTSPTTPKSPTILKDQKDKTAVSVSQSLVCDDGDASIKIPPFYFPHGRPAVNSEETDVTLKLAKDYLQKSPDAKLKQEQMHDFAKALGLPKYWGVLLYNATGAPTLGYFSIQNFINIWQGITAVCHDDASRFMRLLAKPCKTWLEPEDFVPLIQDVVNSHPGLQFLQDAVDFHSRYIHCVISRIFYTVNSTWSGKMTIAELRRSNLLQAILLLEEEDDINQITDYFSYEHFYVIYCKFWELDKDHDLFIDKDDLARHNDHALSSRIIDRLFSGAVTRIKQGGKMSYTDFVAFILSEEDKKTDKSVEYWFRCMDLDGDGYISMFEMEYFYEEQIQKMEDMGIDPLPYYDLLCQMLDLVSPALIDKISLADLKKCKQGYIFFDTMFNLEKYLDHEQRDPFANTKDLELEGPEPSDWDKFASEEYELLVAEENANEEQESFDYEDDFDGEGEEEIPPQQESIKTSSPELVSQNRRDHRPKSAKQANSQDE